MYVQNRGLLKSVALQDFTKSKYLIYSGTSKSKASFWLEEFPLSFFSFGRESLYKIPRKECLWDLLLCSYCRPCNAKNVWAWGWNFQNPKLATLKAPPLICLWATLQRAGDYVKLSTCCSTCTSTRMRFRDLMQGRIEKAAYMAIKKHAHFHRELEKNENEFAMFFKSFLEVICTYGDYIAIYMYVLRPFQSTLLNNPDVSR